MLVLAGTLLGFSLVESFNVLNLAITSAIVYDSRLQRRSPLPGGLGFLAGLFTATASVGITVVLGVSALHGPTAIGLTPTMRHRGELAIGVILICLACYPRGARIFSPRWSFADVRRNLWLLAGFGAALGLGQSATDVMYLAALAMLSTHQPRPSIWPVIVLGYCAIELWPPVLVLFLASRRTARARRVQRRLLRVISRFAPVMMRALCLAAGLALVIRAAVYGDNLG